MNDNELIIDELPVLPSNNGGLKKLSLVLDIANGPASDSRELLVVDQILIGGLSPTCVTLGPTNGYDILVRVGDPLFEPVPYACFLRSSASQLLQMVQARIIGKHLLKCMIEKTANPGVYQLGISVKADVLPQRYKDFYILEKP